MVFNFKYLIMMKVIIFYSWISFPIILVYIGCNKIENPIELSYISIISMFHLIF